MPDEIRIKGTNILGVVGVLEALRGLEYHDAVVRDMEGEGGEALRSRSLIAAGWYPVAWYRALFASAVRHADPSVVRLLGRSSTRANMSTIHRVFMRMMNPDTLIKQGGRVFSNYFESASVSVQNVGQRVEHLTWKGCHGFDRNCWRDQVGATEELVALSGARLLRGRILSGGEDGDPEMVMEIAWR